MEEKAEVFVIIKQSLQDKICTIGGQKVMLVFNLLKYMGIQLLALMSK